MDTALSNGDFLKNSKGMPVMIDGTNELLQRALIRMTVKKGSFTYDKELGSELYKLKTSYKNDDILKEKVLIYIKEALLPMKEVSVVDATLERQSNMENLNITVYLTVVNKPTEIEVII